MHAWQEDTVQGLLNAQSASELFASLLGHARQLGFDYCAYGARFPTPISNPQIVMHNNYSDQWRTTYAEQGFIKVDPTVMHGLTSSLPVVWSDQLFAKAPQLWDGARDNGLRIGWAQPCTAPGGVRGLLTLARSAEALSPSELIAKQERMSWLAQLAHEYMVKQIRDTHEGASSTEPLTEREIEILRWTADGKTALDVAEILNITERTVNFHINKCVEKLQVNNKLAATVRAAMMGLL